MIYLELSLHGQVLPDPSGGYQTDGLCGGCSLDLCGRVPLQLQHTHAHRYLHRYRLFLHFCIKIAYMGWGAGELGNIPFLIKSIENWFFCTYKSITADIESI